MMDFSNLDFQIAAQEDLEPPVQEPIDSARMEFSIAAPEEEPDVVENYPETDDSVMVSEGVINTEADRDKSIFDRVKNLFDTAVQGVNSTFNEAVQRAQEPNDGQMARGVVDDVAELTMDPEKWAYMNQGAWQMSLTVQVLRQLLEREINVDLENSLTTKDKLMMQAMAMGPDIWLFTLGGFLPKMVQGGIQLAGPGLRSLPVIQKFGEQLATHTMQSGASFGFFEGMRTLYTNMLREEGDAGKLKFIDLVGKTLADSMNGFSLGALMTGGQQLRRSVFSSSTDAFEGTVRSGAILPVEASAIGMLQAQLHQPGVLPDWGTFRDGAALMMGFELVTHYNMFANRMTNNHVFNNMVSAGNRYGIAPDTLYELSRNDVTILEDLNRPELQGKVRSLEKDATGKDIPNEPEVDELLSMLNGELKPKVQEPAAKPTSDLVNKEGVPPVEGMVAPEGAVQAGGAAAPAAPQPPPILLQDQPGMSALKNPMGLKTGDPHDIRTMNDGTQIALPHSSLQSIALSGKGMLFVPYVLTAMKDFMQGKIRIEKRRVENDPDLEGSWGYFSDPVREKAMRLREIDSRIKSVARTMRTASKEQDANSVKMSSDLIAELRKERADLDATDYSEFPRLIVINEEVSQGRSPILLLILTHEIGHAIAAVNKGWKQAGAWGNKPTNTLPGNADIFRPGLSNEFWTAMSNYYQTFDSLWSWALDPANGIDPIQLRQEADVISRLWRPISDARLLANPEYAGYRAKGSELVADLVSAHLHRPDIVAQYAPTIHKAMEVFFEGRDPEAKQFVERMQYDMATDRDVPEAIRMLNESTRKGEFQLESMQHGAEAMNLMRRLSTNSHKILGSFFDSFNIVYQLAPKLAATARNAMERFQYSTPIKKGYDMRVAERVVTPLTDLGFALDEISTLLSVKRVMHDESRQGISNGAFGDLTDANTMYDRLIADKRLSEPQVAGLLAKLGDARRETLIQEMKRSELYGDDFLDHVTSNEWYVRFESMEHAYQAILDGKYSTSGRGKRGQQALTAKEAESMKQTGSLGAYRNSLSSTLAYDDFLFTMLLREGAMKKLLAHGIQTKEFPVFLESQFLTMKKHAPDMLKQYAGMDFMAVSQPQRVLDKKTGTYVTKRVTYMVPRDIVEPFFQANRETKQLIADAATVSIPEIFAAAKDKTTPLGKAGTATAGLALAGGAKLLMGSAGVFRTLTILWNMGFQAVNILVRDPGRSARNMAVLSPVKGSDYLTSGRVWEVYGETYKNLIGTFKKVMGDGVDPSILELLDRGLISSREEFIAGAGPMDLGQRILATYGTSGYRNKVYTQIFSQGFGILSLLQRANHRLDSALGTLTDAGEMNAKLAADNVLKKKRAAGEINISDAEHDMFIRGMAGSPPYSIKGQNSTAIAMFSPFFGAIVQGLRGDYRAYKMNRQKFLMASMPTMIFGMVQGAALSGWFDDIFDTFLDKVGVGPRPRVSDVMKTAGSHELASSMVLPMGIDSDTGHGERFTVPLLQDPFDILLHNLGMNMVRGVASLFKENPKDKGVIDAKNGLSSLASSTLFSPYDAITNMNLGLTPNVNPLITIASKGHDLMTEGNYFDPFRNDMKFQNDILDVDKRFGKLPGLVAQEFGVPKSLRNASDYVFHDSSEPDSKRPEWWQSIPGLSDPVMRFFKSDNKGYEERTAKEKQRLAYDKAVAGEDMATYLRAITKGDHTTAEELMPRLLDSGARGVATSQMYESRKKAQQIENIENIYLKRLEKDGTNTAVDEILRLNGKDPKATEAYNFLFSGRK